MWSWYLISTLLERVDNGSMYHNAICYMDLIIWIRLRLRTHDETQDQRPEVCIVLWEVCGRDATHTNTIRILPIYMGDRSPVPGTTYHSHCTESPSSVWSHFLPSAAGLGLDMVAAAHLGLWILDRHPRDPGPGFKAPASIRRGRW